MKKIIYSNRVKSDNPFSRKEVIKKIVATRRRNGSYVLSKSTIRKIRAGAKKTGIIVHERVMAELKEFERQGYRCIPITKVVPDAFLVRVIDGKLEIAALEVEYGKHPDYGKYVKKGFSKYYDNVIWLLRKTLLNVRGKVCLF